MVKKILSILLWVVTAAAIVVLFVYAREDYLSKPVKAINVTSEIDTGFVRKSVLHDELKQICSRADIGSANMVAIQNLLGKSPWVETSTSYIDLGGTLNVNFKEYEPKFRIFGKNGNSVYVTDEGVIIPSSRNYTPYVLVANGNFDIVNDSTSYRLNDTIESDRNFINALHWFKAIDANNFIRNCVGQLYCNSKNEFELSVRGLDASVIVGDTCDAADKLKRLEVFVKQRINNFETQTLKNINLNYKNQIVCTKR